MRTGYFKSLFFAFLASASIAAIAAPVVPSEPAKVLIAMDATSTSHSAKVDLNQADSATLQKELAGIGEAKAKAIVAYRDANGPFASVDELLEVKGIGKAILDRNREKLEVN
ncbi:ComE operon protein 1 [Pseudomonas sp. AD21]|uniref:ComEA family DNA-binding protein n=1 Tax=Pseudomonas sp. AD21 TaxID=396378 RepID=UPI000C837300|nr:helix-hairpin-helix domain-containing protein [Pseudomonas sp. AD21]PMQ14338.1 ComE operon protein 1 [Pseudomonas sp. AD21]